MEIDVSTFAPDLGSIDLLARLHLRAQRRGYRLRLRNASRELLDLIALAGLTEALYSSKIDDQEVNGCQ